MTNEEKWCTYMSTCPAPEKFIRFGLYSLIGSTLQRKVWTGSPHFSKGNPLFTNQFVILCAEPGIGKGIVIKPVKKVLTHFRKDGKENNDKNFLAEDGTEEEAKIAKAAMSPETLIKVGSDSLTCESMIRELTESVRTYWYQPQGGPNKIPYFHSSLTIASEELSTMFKKKTENLVNFFMQAYDAGDFRYTTIGRGTDFIKNCCFNFLGGTTPNFVHQVFDDALLNEGFASRTIFVYAEKARFWRARPPEITAEQEMARDEFLQHVKKLTTLFGEVKFHADAIEYLENWWSRTNINPGLRPNQNPKLQHYYSRKNIHVQKLAMALHFLEHTTMEVSLAELIRAIEILDENELEMHKALMTRGENPLATVTKSILKYLVKNGPKTRQELWIEFYEEFPGQNSKDALEQVTDFLLATKKIKLENQQYHVI